jgi:aspartate oxidase
LTNTAPSRAGLTSQAVKGVATLLVFVDGFKVLTDRDAGASLAARGLASREILPENPVLAATKAATTQHQLLSFLSPPLT